MWGYPHRASISACISQNYERNHQSLLLCAFSENGFPGTGPGFNPAPGHGRRSRTDSSICVLRQVCRISSIRVLGQVCRITRIRVLGQVCRICRHSRTPAKGSCSHFRSWPGWVISPPGFIHPPGSINAKGRRFPKSMLEFPCRLKLKGAILKVVKECKIINSPRGVSADGFINPK